MFYIPIILGSTRRGRQSAKVARFVESRMKKSERIETEILDLLDYNFPMMEERLRCAMMHRRELLNLPARLPVLIL